MGREERNRGERNDAVPSEGEGREEEEEEGEDVFRCGSCDEKSGERLETRGGEEGKGKGERGMEDCALFIRADTSECVIHPEKGISQQTPTRPPTHDKTTTDTMGNAQ